MDIRRAQPADADALLRFWTEAGASLSTTDDVPYLRRAIENPAAALIVAEANERLVGSILGAFDGWRGNLYRLVVHPSYRRQGIARALVREIERIFVAWGVRRVTVLVELDRPWATQFWQAVGYPRDEHIARHLGIIEARPIVQ
jgi:ribosomal protein S18 acetylase RimI-like enzyme